MLYFSIKNIVFVLECQSFCSTNWTSSSWYEESVQGMEGTTEEIETVANTIIVVLWCFKMAQYYVPNNGVVWYKRVGNKNLPPISTAKSDVYCAKSVCFVGKCRPILWIMVI